MIIGSTKDFAIQYEMTNVESHKLGKVVIWLGGYSLGCFTEETSLGVVASSLKDSLEFPVTWEAKYEKFSIEGLYDYSNELTTNKRYVLSLGESFDDFSIRIFIKRNTVLFLWKLWKDSYFTYDFPPEVINSYTCDRLVFNKVVEHFCKNIDQEFKPEILKPG